MAKLIINGKEVEVEVEVEDGQSIREKCEDEGLFFACGEGVCGTCLVKIEEGMDNLTDFTQAERDFLGIEGKERLACQCRIKKGCVKLKF